MSLFKFVKEVTVYNFFYSYLSKIGFGPLDGTQHSQETSLFFY